MPVNAISAYSAQSRDRLENFNGLQLVYIGWDRHLMFCAPMTFALPPAMPFAEFIDSVVKPAIAPHPDAAQVDFAKAQWLLDDQPFTPDLNASLTANGVGHKSLLYLTTPGLNGIKGSGN